MILAVDPGKTNMGVWFGRVSVSADGKYVPETTTLEKFDMGAKVPLYKGAVEVLAKGPWFEQECSAVIETQDPKNAPARVVACTAYGYLRGRGLDCEFSSSRLKNDAIAELATQYSVQLIAKPPLGADAGMRRRQMYAANKKNSKAVVFKLLETVGQSKLLGTLEDARDPQGRKKADDMTDALLLGIGLWMKKKGLPIKEKKRRARLVRRTPEKNVHPL